MKDHPFSFSLCRNAVSRIDSIPEQHSWFDDTEVDIVLLQSRSIELFSQLCYPHIFKSYNLLQDSQEPLKIRNDC
jgi:hypothetical protein